MNFVTVLHSLKSPQNVGMIVRSHVAHGGKELVFLGSELPWEFKKGSQSFSRKLEKQIEILHFKEDSDYVDWVRVKGYQSVALETSNRPTYLNEYVFNQDTAFILGNEAHGLSSEFLSGCDAVLTIPQYGSVGSLNVAVSASIAMYEFMRNVK